MEANCRRRRALHLENELEEGKRYTAACGVTGKDDLGRGDGSVKGIGGRVEKGEIREEGVQKSRGKGMLRGKTVTDREAAAAAETGKLGHGGAMGARITQEEASAMKIENCHVARDFGHELLIVLGFGQVGARPLRLDIGSVACPFDLNGDDVRNRVCFSPFEQIINGFNQRHSNVIFFGHRQRDF